MLSKIWVVSALCAIASSAPTLNVPSASSSSGEREALSEYFSLLATKIQDGRKMSSAPVCDLSNAKLPATSPTPLPPATTGLSLVHVAVGRGTQNYTCSTNSTSAPTAVGAVATLFNASCLASSYPDLLATIPKVSLQFNLTSTYNQKTLIPSNIMVSGHHFFTNNSTPFFNLNSATMTLGEIPAIKDVGVPAPAGAPVGQGGKGFGAVPWLKLNAREGATAGLKEVYRVNTAGGSAPPTCAGYEQTTFEVQYAAEYWFYAA